jgi:hypothetical protein
MKKVIKLSFITDAFSFPPPSVLEYWTNIPKQRGSYKKVVESMPILYRRTMAGRGK